MWEPESHALPLGDTPIKFYFGAKKCVRLIRWFNFLKSFKKWLGWLDLNLRMRESKSRALPLGDTPITNKYKILAIIELKKSGAGDGNRTHAISLEG